MKKPTDKTKTALAVIPADGDGKSLTVRLFDLSAEQHADAIKADIAQYERTSREAAFIALRIGMRLVWIRDNSPHGSLKQFTDAHFAGKSRPTLFRYIKVADTFLQEAGLVDKKTLKLTGKALATAAPIVTEQLELFTDPAAKLEGAMKKVVAWVGKRGLAEIYAELETRKTHTSMPPPGGKSAKNGFKGGASTRADADTSEGAMIEHMRALALDEHLNGEMGVIAMRDSGAWRHLDPADLAALDHELDTWRTEIKALIRERQDTELRSKPKAR